MKRLIKGSAFEYVQCMSNARGKDIRVPNQLSFSFYYGSKKQENDTDSVHGIRVKIVPNPEKVIKQEFSILELHGDMRFHQNPNAKIGGKTLKEAKEFFSKNKVLFAAVWEEELDENDLRDYLEGKIALKELVSMLDVYDESTKDVLDNVESIEDLETAVRSNSLFNMND